MTYAVNEDLIDRVGEERLIVASDMDGDQQLDETALTNAMGDAGAEIDVWLEHCYELPIAQPLAGKFRTLKRVQCDIAFYRLGSTAQAVTEEKRTRYEDALATLGLLCPRAREIFEGSLDETSESSGAVTLTGPGRVFSRESMKGLL